MQAAPIARLEQPFPTFHVTYGRARFILVKQKKGVYDLGSPGP